MDPSVLPPFAAKHARSSLADPQRTVVEPKLAASTMLIREGETPGPGGVELFFMKRHAQMAFAATAAVFPGGGVDIRDLENDTGWIGPSPPEWARDLGTDQREARGIVCAAVRETFEESGILLAGPDAGQVVSTEADLGWQRDRRRLEAREISLTDLVAERGLVLRTDLLQFWREWVTPEFEPKRYRTFFFVALVPCGQKATHGSSESEGISWMSTTAALAGAGTDHLLLPPQYCSCAELHEFASPEQVLQAASSGARPAILPRVRRSGDDVLLELPDELMEQVRTVNKQVGVLTEPE